MNGLTVTAIMAVLFLAGGIGLVVYDHAEDGDSPDRIGIIGAMECEVNDVKSEMKIDRTETIADMDFCVGKLYGHHVVVVQCGMGKVNAGLCAETLITHFNVKQIINSGAAGALDFTLHIGDFVICEQIVQHDYDVSAIGFKPHEIPYTEKVYFDSDEKLRDSAFEAVSEVTKKSIFPDAKVVRGLVCTGDQFISSDSQKTAILTDFPDGKCCEMEGGAIAQVCYLNHIPFIVIRAISDNTDGEDFYKYVDEIGSECANAVIAMVRGM